MILVCLELRLWIVRISFTFVWSISSTTAFDLLPSTDILNLPFTKIWYSKTLLSSFITGRDQPRKNRLKRHVSKTGWIYQKRQTISNTRHKLPKWNWSPMRFCSRYMKVYDIWKKIINDNWWREYEHDEAIQWNITIISIKQKSFPIKCLQDWRY